MHIRTVKTKSGVTLLEIMTAMLILGFAFLPIIGVLGTSSKDTDVSNSVVFAQTTARNVLDALLDEVPFNSLRAPSTSDSTIAEIHDWGNYDANSFLAMIGSSDNTAHGTINDGRGNDYEITIHVFPIPVNKSETPNVNDELVFSYLPRPEFEKVNPANWYTYDSSREQDQYLKDNNADPYSQSMIDTCDTVTAGAYKLGALKNDSSEEYYVMKKILFQMKWKNRDGRERFLELYTMKANLDSEAGI